MDSYRGKTRLDYLRWQIDNGGMHMDFSEICVPNDDVPKSTVSSGVSVPFKKGQPAFFRERFCFPIRDTLKSIHTIEFEFDTGGRTYRAFHMLFLETEYKYQTRLFVSLVDPSNKDIYNQTMRGDMFMDIEFFKSSEPRLAFESKCDELERAIKCKDFHRARELVKKAESMLSEFTEEMDSPYMAPAD
jgi:hypothetical protein